MIVTLKKTTKFLCLFLALSTILGVSSAKALDDIIIDNLDTANISSEGNWRESSGSYEWSESSYYGRDGATFKFYFDCPTDGSFEVFEWHSLHSTRSESVQVDIKSDDDSGGIHVTRLTVNQQEGGQNWNSLGEFDFTAGNRYEVTIISPPGPTTSSADTTSADAIMFRKVAENTPQQVYAFPIFNVGPTYFTTPLNQIGATEVSQNIWRFINNQGKEFIIHISRDDITTMIDALTTDSIVIMAGHANYGSGHAPANYRDVADGRVNGILYVDDPGLLKMTSPFFDVGISGLRSHYDPAWQPIFRSGESAIRPYGFFDPRSVSPPYNYEIVYKMDNDPTCYSTGVERMLPSSNADAWFDSDCGDPDPTNPDHWKYFITQPVFYKIGNWLVDTSTDDYGSNYQYSEPGFGDKKVIWETRVPEAGDYLLYAWWPASAANANDATYTVNQPDGSEIAVFENVDQRSGGSWQKLGQFSISNPGPLAVILTNAADSGDVVADAVRIVSVDNQSVFDQIIDNTTSPSNHYSYSTILRRNGPPEISADRLRFKKLYLHSCQTGRYYLQQYTKGVVFYSIPSISGIHGQKWLMGVLQGKSDYQLWQILQNVTPDFDYYSFDKYPWEQ